jgi:hypothetical protein
MKRQIKGSFQKQLQMLTWVRTWLGTRTLKSSLSSQSTSLMSCSARVMAWGRFYESVSVVICGQNVIWTLTWINMDLDGFLEPSDIRIMSTSRFFKVKSFLIGLPETFKVTPFQRIQFFAQKKRPSFYRF